MKCSITCSRLHDYNEIRNVATTLNLYIYGHLWGKLENHGEMKPIC